jgi:hypothetical protein
LMLTSEKKKNDCLCVCLCVSVSVCVCVLMEAINGCQQSPLVVAINKSIIVTFT